MLIATTYPFLEIVWTLFVFFAFIVWLWILFTVLGDLFRRHDTSAMAKVLWIIFIIVVPYVGVFVYLLTQHNGMTERTIKQQERVKGEVDEYVRSVSGGPSATEEIAKAHELLDRGAITQAEFDQIKAKALAS